MLAFQRTTWTFCLQVMTKNEMFAMEVVPPLMEIQEGIFGEINLSIATLLFSMCIKFLNNFSVQYVK